MGSDYRFLLDPALGLSASQVATAWREIPDCAEAGRCSPATKEAFDFVLSDATAAAFVLTVAGVAKDVIVELVKRALARADAAQKKNASDEPVVEQIPDPQTGLPLFRVTRKTSRD